MNKKAKQEFEETGRRLISDIITQKEIDQSWQAIENESNKFFAAPRRLMLYIGSIAASIAVLLLLFLMPHNEIPHTLSVEMLKDSIDYVGKEIVLITDNTHNEIVDESTLKYDADGKLLSANTEKNNLEGVKLNEIIVPKGKRMSIQFSDGTHIQINSGSRVVYPSVFANDKREILVQGEVFLNVAKDSERPFIVKTPNLDVKVLGTSFNISAYKEDMATSVVLVEGSVEVKSSGNETQKIKPNQKLTFANLLISVQTVDVEEYTAWTRDIMMLNNMQCGEILKRLSRFYGVNIHFDASVNNLVAGGDLNMKNGLNDALNNLSITFNLKYITNADGSITVFLD